MVLLFTLQSGGWSEAVWGSSLGESEHGYLPFRARFSLQMARGFGRRRPGELPPLVLTLARAVHEDMEYQLMQGDIMTIFLVFEKRRKERMRPSRSRSLRACIPTAHIVRSSNRITYPREKQRGFL